VNAVNLQIQDAQQILDEIISIKSTPTNIIIILLKIKEKEKILRAARENQ
jgi:hypothetical protein